MHLRRRDRWARSRALHRAKHGLIAAGLLVVPLLMAALAG